ncbi:hypothetical protein [Pseudoalteromonas luteoviolacea]|uniref:Porin n=1 Tax=Pseudoalteromonas luteoviolacea H33 TaxID=1365251 RepID=A0A167DD82_9GAMM|nr:hypothetical protein [Pseudoalteromonas luteoviolacea]KZN48692.1 hypothetical protein N476_20990 [Pseudoalteromonas luteoviolacea H33]KZN75473.1 hypothetical protein N477_01795 [Pseudoalteromonas luteoviolacea H33-S]
MKFKYAALLGVVSAITLSPAANAYLYKDPGYVERNVRTIQKNNVIGQSHQYRDQQGWMYVDQVSNGATQGAYQAGNWIKLHNRNFKMSIGELEFSFDPSKLDCTQGMSFNFTVGDDTVASFKPNCDDLLNASITYPIEYYFDLIPEPIKPKVELPLDPLGLLKVGVKFGAGVEAGAEFTVGGVIGGHGNEEPYEVDGIRRPDYVYASVEPYVGGLVSSSAYGSFGHGISEAGVKGKLNLLKVKGKGYVEAGIRRVVQDTQVVEQGFLELKISTKLTGGDGKIQAYCKKLWGLLQFNVDVMKWDPLYTRETVLYEYASPVWENL